MRDAERVEFPSTKFPRIDPRAPLVWIRADGAWRPGRITKWVKDGERWVVWVAYETDKPWPTREWLLYEPETIRERADDDQAPPD